MPGRFPSSEPWLVIAARRAGFGEFRHAPDDEIGLRQYAEPVGQLRADRAHLLVQIGEQLVLAFVGVGITQARVVEETAQALAHRAFAETLLLQIDVELARVVGHHVETRVVDLIRRHRRRRPEGEAIAIVLIAVRQLPYARVVRGFRLELGQSRDLPIKCGIDRRPGDLERTVLIIAVDLVFLHASADGRDHHRLLRRHGTQHPKLRKGLRQHEIRRDDAQARIVAHDFGVIVERDDLCKPRKIGFGVSLVLDRLEILQEVGEFAVEAVELVDDVGVARDHPAAIAEVVAPVDRVTDRKHVEHDVVVETVRIR